MKKIKMIVHKISHQLGMSCLCLVLLLASCEKFVQLDLPKTQLAAKAVFENEATAQAALASLYTKAVGLVNGSYNSVSLLAAQSSDENECWSTNLSVQQVFNNQLLPSNSYSTSIWSASYEVIYAANSILEGTTDHPKLSTSVKNQLQGEALFFRGLCHLTLANFFGSVPLVLTTDYQANTRMPQSSNAQILAAVASDLKKAKSLLPPDYAIGGGERIRANAYAASALLARVYLYQGEWALAEQEAGLLIAASNTFSLPALSDVFLKNSRETILSYKPFATNQNTGDGNVYVLTAKPTYTAMRKSFYDGFEAGDLRRSAWTGKVTSSGVDYYFPFKYKIKTGATVSEYSILLRLAEQYLIRAEARTRLDRLSEAISDLDMVRFRAGLSKLAVTNPTIGKEALLEQILKERRSELFTEWGHRWMDLRRFGQLSAVLTPIKPGFVATAALYPIPQSELNVNPSLVPNPGY